MARNEGTINKASSGKPPHENSLFGENSWPCIWLLQRSDSSTSFCLLSSVRVLPLGLTRPSWFLPPYVKAYLRVDSNHWPYDEGVRILPLSFPKPFFAQHTRGDCDKESHIACILEMLKCILNYGVSRIYSRGNAEPFDRCLCLSLVLATHCDSWILEIDSVLEYFSSDWQLFFVYIC